MTDRIRSLLTRTFDKEQKKFRRDVDWKPLLDGFVRDGTDDSTRARVGLVEMLKAEVEKHRDGAEPNDDLTMLCFKVKK
jgi:hypothetical protein